MRKYEKAVQIKPDYPEAYNNWGAGLYDLAKRKQGPEADRLYAQACRKFERAVQIRPDKGEVYKNWGSVLLDWAKTKDAADRETLLGEAREKYLRTESIKPGESAYNLACIYALLGDEGECQKWLKMGHEAQALPARSCAMSDADLESVRDAEWFRQIRWPDDET